MGSQAEANRIEYFFFMATQFSKEFSITTCDVGGVSIAFKACLDKCKWTNHDEFMGIMQRLYL